MSESLFAALSAVCQDVVVSEPNDPSLGDEGDLVWLSDDERIELSSAAASAIIVRPRTESEVVKIIKVAAAERASLVVRGGGTNRTLAARAQNIVLGTEHLTQMSVDVGDRIAVVQAGVTLADLKAAALAEGLWYGPDPNSEVGCTLGGTIATNAAGPRHLKYGATRDWIRGLTFVDGHGRVHHVGGRTSKSSVGYPLQSFLVGSEGTLGVVTEAVVKLVERPERNTWVLIGLRERAGIAKTVRDVLGLGVGAAALELIDALTMPFFRTAGFPFSATEQATLAIEFCGTCFQVEQSVDVLSRYVMAAGLDALVLQTETEQTRFRAVRKDLSRSLRSLGLSKVSEDVVVPLSKLDSLLSLVSELETDSGLQMAAYGHVGDANLHVNILYDDKTTKPALLHSVVHRLMNGVTEMGGSLSGEHGIGRAKRNFMGLQFQPATLSLMRELKQVFDPHGILNRGVLFR